MPRSIIETATDLLPLSRLFFEIRLPPDNASENETNSLRGVIEDAVDAVSADSYIPIVPEMASVKLDGRRSGVINYTDDPFALNFAEINALQSASSQNNLRAGLFDTNLEYTPVNQPINDNAPVGEMSAILMQATGPSYANAIKLTYRRGLLLNSKSIGNLRTLAILKARSIWDGTITVPDKTKSAYERVLEKTRFEGILPDTFNRLGD